jgi:hypothetical protein
MSSEKTNLTKKQMTCIRQIANISMLKNEFRFDNKKFSPKDFSNQIDFYSPKLSALLQKIEEVDKNDIKNFGKTFKHFIFSDVDKGYGAKLIAAALLSKNYKMVFTKKTATTLGFDENALNSES